MAETTAIEWTATYHDDGTVTPGATFNPWHGCTKVSQGCKHCYAETLSHRWGRNDLWGPTGTRKKTSDAYWREPDKWNRAAEAAGTRRKVFCASMADVFEDRPELTPWRIDLFRTIVSTPHLDWLLLTKRPGNVLRMYDEAAQPLGKSPVLPDNIWIGTSVENQEAADERMPILAHIPAIVRFLSCEPLLGPLDLGFGNWRPQWVIVGGESGPGARPMEEAWVRSIQEQCAGANVPFFFKQWGGVNKKAAGRLLDGREWNGMP